MSLKCGIVGLPNVGKSTLFNCLSNAKAQSANFPFCTIEPNIGTISVPDPRLEKLESLVNPERVIPTTMEILDIAGLVKGASKGEGLGNKFLANIRETDAILHVLRCFEDGNIVHVDGDVDPMRDKEIIDIELQLKDLESVEKKITSLSRVIKSGDKDAVKENELAQKLKEGLEQGLSVRALSLNDEELELLRSFNLITAKPVMYVCNVDEASVQNGNKYTQAFIDKFDEKNTLIVSADIENQINQLENEEKENYMEMIGLKRTGLNMLIQKGYNVLELDTYFTSGPEETRAWTIQKNCTAPKAAGEIHTDFEKGFIRAETIAYEDFIANDGWVNSKTNGKMRLEGKDYIVKDGDMLNFRFNT